MRLLQHLLVAARKLFDLRREQLLACSAGRKVQGEATEAILLIWTRVIVRCAIECVTVGICHVSDDRAIGCIVRVHRMEDVPVRRGHACADAFERAVGALGEHLELERCRVLIWEAGEEAVGELRKRTIVAHPLARDDEDDVAARLEHRVHVRHALLQGHTRTRHVVEGR